MATSHPLVLTNSTSSTSAVQTALESAQCQTNILTPSPVYGNDTKWHILIVETDLLLYGYVIVIVLQIVPPSHHASRPAMRLDGQSGWA